MTELQKEEAKKDAAPTPVPAPAAVPAETPKAPETKPAEEPKAATEEAKAVPADSTPAPSAAAADGYVRANGDVVGLETLYEPEQDPDDFEHVDERVHLTRTSGEHDSRSRTPPRQQV